MSVPMVTFNNGQQLPILGLGTWQSQANDVKNSVRAALDAGYRHIDTAWFYENEKEIGEVLQEYINAGKLKRNDFYITSKVWVTRMAPKHVHESIDDSLAKLQLDYVDLYLIHIPMPCKDTGVGFPPKYPDGSVAVDPSIRLEDTWKAMEKLVGLGKTKSIGVSNFTTKQVERICKSASILPVTNQVECHAYFNRKKFQEFHKQYNILITSFASLGSPGRMGISDSDPVLLDDQVIKHIADIHKKTVAQVLLRNLIQRNIIVIPKSIKPHRVQENFNVLDFELSPSEMQQIDQIDKNCRLFRMEGGEDHPEFPFAEKF